MKSLQQSGIFVAISLLITACTLVTPARVNNRVQDEQPDFVIAFMPDIHFHDIYGDIQTDAKSEENFAGLSVATESGNQQAYIRSMKAQLQSTRLFNENYFAFIAALDDVVKRGIHYLALPGDFTDDGQPMHLRGLKNILDKYHKEHGLEFFIINGNHDPVKPFTRPGGKSDFLGSGGKEQPIYSPDHPYCISAYDKQNDTKVMHKNTANTTAQHIVCSGELKESGYETIMSILADYGFYPKATDVYYETPYSQYQKSYEFTEAQKQATFNNRQYEICAEGTGGRYKHPNYTQCKKIPDSSYLVEPTPGLWLLAIDANVYLPDLKDTDHYLGSGDAGYNKVITHKTHLLAWITDVVKRAKQQHKQLIAFSHFPMEEFYDGESDNIENIFGKDKFQLKRRPSNITSTLLADTGLNIHVGGHMHMNDTGVYKGESGNTLVNIQAPSLAAYAPAYKVLSFNTQNSVEVETVVLTDVAHFNQLFPLYEQEWNYLHQAKDSKIWNKAILSSTDYYEYTQWHLRELARLRFLPQEWPEDLRRLIENLRGDQLLILSQYSETISEKSLRILLSIEHTTSLPANWLEAKKAASTLAEDNGYTLKQFEQWSGKELGVDFYRLCNAEQLALRDIGEQRLEQYKLLARAFSKKTDYVSTDTTDMKYTVSQSLRKRFAELLDIMMQFSAGDANDHFTVDLETGTITDLTKIK